MTVLTTIKYDIELNKQLLYLLREESSGVLEFSFLQNFSLIIHEAIKSLGLSLNDKGLQDDIATIRLKIKGIRKGSREVLESILDAHIAYFGDDVDNIGFYHHSHSMKGSTLYPLYLTQGTTIMNPLSLSIDSGTVFKELGVKLGSLIAEIEESVLSCDKEDSLSIRLKPTYLKESYKLKDTHHSEVFRLVDPTTDILLFQVILKKQELTFVKWLLNVFSENTFENKYILLRYISITAHEIMKMINNAKKFMQVDYQKLNVISNGSLEEAFVNYENELASECQKLRNFLHYNRLGENFYDYCISRENEMKNYMQKEVELIWTAWLLPLDEIFNKFIDLGTMKSRTDIELIMSRIKTLFKPTKR